MNQNIAVKYGVKLIDQHPIIDIDKRLEEIVALGGEGIVLSNMSAYWSPVRTGSVLKYKPTRYGKAKVIGYTEGKNRNVGRTGAIILEFEGGTRFKINCKGDSMRINPPAIGTIKEFMYRELTDLGVPKEARFVEE
jgi:DNA ligase-1